MARRGWGGSIATAAGVAAGAAAAQLGFGYGLGIINWAPAEAGAGTAAWVASLTWATWIAATSTVFGAVCAQRLQDRGPTAGPAGDDPSDVPATVSDPGTPAGTGASVPDAGEGGAGTPGGGSLHRIALAVAAGLGALITVLLVAVPARVAVVPDASAPRNVAAAYASVGLLIGVLTAVWALHSRAAATNVIATVGWLWLLAVAAVVDGVLAGRGLTTAQLGIWQLSADDARFWIRDWFYWPGALLSLGSALVIGVLAARRAARHADRRVGATASGAAGPLLVAVAYLLAVPRLTAISPEQMSAHLIAPYAVIVGVGGSVLVATLAQRRRPVARGRVALPGQRTGEPAETVGRPAEPVGAVGAADPELAGAGHAGTRSGGPSGSAGPAGPAAAAGRARKASRPGAAATPDATGGPAA
ncbi:hypothetical protein [Micromonospora deserti]|uniref:hypothetical protein n=1 Tax=Micromonospora deserti TaxID=2070366 RepID=UPI001F15FD28|nr:hypothetical protein [Micromonospora deserti]